MQIMDAINQMGGLKAFARELGVSESQVSTGAEALLPAIRGGFKKQAQPGAAGLGGLGGLLGTDRAGGLASMLDLDRDGNPLDDILGMLGGQKR
jgi:hypothetical protein